jgi:hypothetical protein
VVGLGGLVVIVLAIGPKVIDFKPGRGRWIFEGDRNLWRRINKEAKVHTGL